MGVCKWCLCGFGFDFVWDVKVLGFRCVLFCFG